MFCSVLAKLKSIFVAETGNNSKRLYYAKNVVPGNGGSSSIPEEALVYRTVLQNTARNHKAS